MVTNRPHSESFDSQILYKLGNIESQIESIRANLASSVSGIEDKIESSSKHAANSILLAEKRVDLIEKRIERDELRLTSLESWRTQLFTKLGFVVSGVSVFWLVFGNGLEQSIASIF